MAKLNHRLAVAAGTVMALAGVTGAVAWVTNYQTAGQETVSLPAGAVTGSGEADERVTFSVPQFDQKVTNLLKNGTASFTVRASASASVQLPLKEVLPKIDIPNTNCPGDAFGFGAFVLTPSLFEEAATVTTVNGVYSNRETLVVVPQGDSTVLTVEITYNKSFDGNQTGCGAGGATYDASWVNGDNPFVIS